MLKILDADEPERRKAEVYLPQYFAQVQKVEEVAKRFARGDVNAVSVCPERSDRYFPLIRHSQLNSINQEYEYDPRECSPKEAVSRLLINSGILISLSGDEFNEALSHLSSYLDCLHRFIEDDKLIKINISNAWRKGAFWHAHTGDMTLFLTMDGPGTLFTDPNNGEKITYKYNEYSVPVDSPTYQVKVGEAVFMRGVLTHLNRGYGDVPGALHRGPNIAKDTHRLIFGAVGTLKYSKPNF